MGKLLLTSIGTLNAALFAAVLAELIFAYKGPVFQFAEANFRNNNISYPAQFYAAILVGFALFSAYGFVNRNKAGAIFPGAWKNWAVLVASAAVTVFLINRIWDTPFFERLYFEDNLFENLTFVFLLAAFVLLVRTLLLLKAGRSALSKVIIGLLALFCFVVAGEEISWGQRIFGWESPEGWEEVNFQNETNVHNVAGVLEVQRVMKIGFTLCLSLILGFSLLLRKKLKETSLGLLVPDSRLFLFAFLVPIVHGFHELSEIIIATVLIFYSWGLFSRLRS